MFGPRSTLDAAESPPTVERSSFVSPYAPERRASSPPIATFPLVHPRLRKSSLATPIVVPTPPPRIVGTNNNTTNRTRRIHATLTIRGATPWTRHVHVCPAAARRASIRPSAAKRSVRAPIYVAYVAYPPHIIPPLLPFSGGGAAEASTGGNASASLAMILTDDATTKLSDRARGGGGI
ncbi:hypothetical protein B0H16DRAFT_1714523 [Mycena metata]|uniref:Uncharacterized protein n=1 Tax=Mycena metata TaxID=1033252 RepID=A0AAD7NRW9_9AGAR|nr:hypothetical protein B0H16DRAFT_1714523 [Mycena metata]